MEKYIDSHAHYDVRKFNKDRNEVLTELQSKVKYIINVGGSVDQNTGTLQLLSLYDFIFGIIGFFPTDTYSLEKDLCKEAEDNWLILTKQLLNHKVVAIGEFGLDYHWDSVGSIQGEKAREIQKKWFRKQLELAIEEDLPVCIHSRDAKEDTIEILKDYPEVRGEVHCFGYDAEMADFLLNQGFYLGVGGTLTYPRNTELREVIKSYPLDKILLETDAPYLSPQPHRRERNRSDYIDDVITCLADLKKISREEIIKTTNNNVLTLFSRIQKY